MSVDDDVHVCAIVKNFKSDVEYLHFGDFWIQRLHKDDIEDINKNLKYFDNYPCDYYLIGRWYYIGRGKSTTVLNDNNIMFFYPLFKIMKLFRRGDLIIPLLFYRWRGKWHEMKFHGESYGLGSWIGGKDELYIFNESDVKIFNIFKEEIEPYLKYINFIGAMPYCKKYEMFNDIDTRCFLAIHILLKESIEHHNPYPVIDALINYSLALESLFILQSGNIKRNLSARIATILGNNDTEEKQISNFVKKFYQIRSDIVHGSLIDRNDYNFLCTNIYNYRDYLRRSILAFLDLNMQKNSKKEVLKMIDESLSPRQFINKNEIRDSLKILKLTQDV
ncbi:MAG: hypothetical protein ABSC11_13525 [Smithella sp.]|jgi:hypothetical protein